MKAPQITPGEWVVSEEMGYGATLVDSDGNLIGYMDRNNPREPRPQYEENKANARFLAASKRMAEALCQNIEAASLLRSQCRDGSDVADVLDSFLGQAKSALLAAGYTE